jgi:murein DD-endopeptidase MepM/ murein hydrolase activator NlpD
VLACADGRVTFTGNRKGYRSYGQAVLVDHGRDVTTHYAHLSKILVRKGEKVRRGQRIALVGSTGRSTSPHLHLEVKEGDQFYNPVAYFNPQRLKTMEVAASYWHTPMGPVRTRHKSRFQKRPSSSAASL